MEVGPRFRDLEKYSFSTRYRCPFNGGNRYIDYVGVFPGPNFFPPEWSCPLNRGVPKERFHCNLIQRVSWLV